MRSQPARKEAPWTMTHEDALMIFKRLGVNVQFSLPDWNSILPTIAWRGAITRMSTQKGMM